MLEQDPQLTTTPFDKTSIENKYHCSIDVERAEEVLGAAIQVYLDKGEFFERKKQAEEDYVNFLIKEQGESNEFVANALFLLSMATFGSDSAIFYDSLVRNKGSYLKNRFLLIPEEVVKTKLLPEREVKIMLKGNPLPTFGDEPRINYEDYTGSFNKAWRGYINNKGRQGDALEGWYHNCEILHRKYGGSVFGLFKACDDDAVKVMHTLIDKPGGKTVNKEIKRFEEKLSSLFLQWIGAYNLYPLSNLDEFGLPVDFQLCRIAVQTGIIDVLPAGKIRRKEFAYKVFFPVIAYLCKENGWEPRLVSESLWLIGSQGCSKDQKREHPSYSCPIRPFCNGVLHKVDNDFLVFVEKEIREKLQRWPTNQKECF